MVPGLLPTRHLGREKGSLREAGTAFNTDHTLLKDDLRKRLRATFTDQDLKRWFDPLSLAVDTDDRRVTVHFPHPFFASWFQEQMQQRFEEALSQQVETGYTVRYQGSSNGAGVGAVKVSTEKPVEFPFGHQYTLDTFLANAKNDFAVNSARAICRQEQIVFNPFVICGDPGSGKTHMLRAIGNELARRHGDRQIYFGSVDDVDALFQIGEFGSAHEVRDYLLNHDALVIDELQRLPDMPALQGELIVLFNALRDSNTQMIFSCAGQVAELQDMDPALKSRLEWGLIVQLKNPDLDIRVRYIQAHCRLKHVPLSGEQILLMAQQVRDLRLVQGLIVKLAAMREFGQKDITNQEFKTLLRGAVGHFAQAVEPEHVISLVAEHYGVEAKDLINTGRRKEVVLARQVAMYLCRNLIRASYPALGRIFGGRDHSTVHYAVKKIEQKRRNDSGMHRLLKSMETHALKEGTEPPRAH